jgi:hypothetical protein
VKGPVEIGAEVDEVKHLGLSGHGFLSFIPL